MTRYVRFSLDSKIFTGTLKGNEIVYNNGKDHVSLTKVKLLAPCEPTKIVGIGLNYKGHALERGKSLPDEPLVFLKALNSLANPGDVIKLNRYCTEVHHEVEFAIVIGKKCSKVSEREALEYVAGYTIANDVSDRPIQKKEPTFARAKGMDTFCPLGPYLVSGVDWKNKRMRLWLNGELKQDSNTNDMIFGVPYIIHFVSQFMTLLPGDVIITGTPTGVGPIHHGNRIKIEIDELGILENTVQSEAG